MTDVNPDAPAPFSNKEKEGLVNDLNFLASMIVEHGQYIFNLIAAVNVQQDILLTSKLVTEDELKNKIEAELKVMKEEFMKQQNNQAAPQA